MPIVTVSLYRKLEFLVTVFLVTVKTIANYKEEEQQGHTECTQIYNGKKLLGVEGDRGSIVSAGYPGDYSSRPADVLHRVCAVSLLSCNSCRFHIVFRELHFPACNGGQTTIEYDSQLRTQEDFCLPGCDHIHLSDGDRPYNRYFHWNFFGVNESSTYDSMTSFVRIIHCVSNRTFRPEEGKKFKITYEVVAKKEEFRGRPSPNDSSSGILVSPNFPHGYGVNGEIFLYSIENLDPNGFIRVVFDDWDIHQKSEIQVFDGALQPPIVLKHFERPILFSNTSSLLLSFHTGSKLSSSCSNIGFKATFTFLSEKTQENIRVDCGATFPTNIGGGLSFHGLSSVYGFLYDCVWIIKKVPEEKSDYEIHLNLKELEMKNGWQFESRNRLEIRNGITSLEPLVAEYTGSEYSQTQTWNTDNSSIGFYVRLKGLFYRQDRVRFSYTAASKMTKDGCPEKFQYPCFNILCISLSLKCDGIDHCGDNSDEAPALNCLASAEEDLTECEGKFLCDGHICLDKGRLCDDIRDCEDESDERDCQELRPFSNGFSLSTETFPLFVLLQVHLHLL